MRYLMAILMGGGLMLAAGCGNLGKAAQGLEEIQTTISDLEDRVDELEDQVADLQDQVDAMAEVEENEEHTTKPSGKTTGHKTGGSKTGGHKTGGSTPTKSKDVK